MPVVRSKGSAFEKSLGPLSRVGERLSALLPNSRLTVFSGAGHDIARTHLDAVATEVLRHLMAGS